MNKRSSVALFLVLLAVVSVPQVRATMGSNTQEFAATAILSSNTIPQGAFVSFRVDFGLQFSSIQMICFDFVFTRSEEHTSELQSRPHLVCRLLLETKKTR